MEAVHSGIKGDVIDGSTDQPVQDAKVHTSIHVGLSKREIVGQKLIFFSLSSHIRYVLKVIKK